MHLKIIHKKETLKTRNVCCIHAMTVQERMAFMSFSDDDENVSFKTWIKMKNSQILPPFNYH